MNENGAELARQHSVDAVRTSIEEFKASCHHPNLSSPQKDLIEQQLSVGSDRMLARMTSPLRLGALGSFRQL